MAYFLILLVAVLLDFSLIHNGEHLPGASILLTQIVYLIFLFFIAKKESKKHYQIQQKSLLQIVFLTIISIMLSIWFAIFTNIFFHVVFLIALIFLDIFLLAIIYNPQYRTFRYISADVSFLSHIGVIFFHNISTGLDIIKSRFFHNNKTKTHSVVIFRALRILILLLLIILPLLISADAVFSSFLNKFFSSLFSIVDIWTICVRELTIGGIFYILGTLYISLGRAHYIGMRIDIPVFQIDRLYNYVILGGINLLYVLFIFIQMRFTWFTDASNFSAFGISYGEYIHSGFYQLLIISGINYILYIYFHKKTLSEKDTIIKMNLYILLITTLLIAYSAFSRILLYIGVYQMTVLRFLVGYIIILTLLLFILNILHLYKARHIYMMTFYRLTLISFIVLGFFNIEKYVAQYNIAHAIHDAEYILSLGDDAIDEKIIAQTQHNTSEIVSMGDSFMVTQSAGDVPVQTSKTLELSPFYYNYYQYKSAQYSRKLIQ